MKGVLIAAVVSLVLSLLGTPWAIRLFRRRGYGQLIREDLATSHQVKRGTPTMGGALIILATLAGYAVAHVATWRGPTASGLLVLGLMTGLGFVGFLDDFTKIRKQRSLGLTGRGKLLGQVAVGVAFAVLALQFDNGHYTPASTHISFVRDVSGFDLTTAGFVIWALLVIAAASNGVNLTDGLDGLASGSSSMVFGAYIIIAFWKFGNSCLLTPHVSNCYAVRDPLDLALVAASGMGACFGFLWWNAYPARIIMGDTGSLALGGAFAGMAITTHTELLLMVLGGLFVVETMSVMLQVGFYKTTKRRVFNMAPIHHHFEMAGWNENTILVRFWIIAGLAVALGLGMFYAEFIAGGPIT